MERRAAEAAAAVTAAAEANAKAEAEAKAEADIQRQSALEDRHATFAWLPCAVKPAHKHGDDSYTRQT